MSNDADTSGKSKTSLKEWAAIITAIVSLITALTTLIKVFNIELNINITTKKTVNRLDQQENQIERNKEYVLQRAKAMAQQAAIAAPAPRGGFVQRVVGGPPTASSMDVFPDPVRIEYPLPETGVKGATVVSGWAEPGEDTRFIYMLVGTADGSGKKWKVTDLVEPEETGIWSARALFKAVPPGKAAYLRAVALPDATQFKVEQTLKKLPDTGVLSNVVEVNRVM